MEFSVQREDSVIWLIGHPIAKISLAFLQARSQRPWLAQSCVCFFLAHGETQHIGFLCCFIEYNIKTMSVSLMIWRLEFLQGNNYHSSLEPSFPFQTSTANTGNERNGETSQATTAVLSGWNKKGCAMLENCLGSWKYQSIDSKSVGRSHKMHDNFMALCLLLVYISIIICVSTLRIECLHYPNVVYWKFLLVDL